MRPVLVINSGSSSLKYQLIDVDTEQALAVGVQERIGTSNATIHHRGATGVVTERVGVIPDHTAAFREMLDVFAEVGPDLGTIPLVALGHRVVHGGSKFVDPTVITSDVESAIDELSVLAPLHNPANLQGIRAARVAFPSVPHVAVFDTAFHHTLPPAAYTYAIDSQLAQQYQIRRYGFHGTSHRYVSGVAARMLDRDPSDVRQIVLHLGNGASACAIRGGVSVDVSMGMTPLEGLVMGTRSGDIDPGALIALARQANLDIDQLDELLNRRSGLVGLTGKNDMRDVRALADSGDGLARRGLDVTIHRLRHYIGAYTAILGGLDALTFTAGIGEKDEFLRAEVCEGLAGLGIVLDATRNAQRSADVRVISAGDSAVTVFVVPTNEELEIARQSVEVTSKSL